VCFAEGSSRHHKHDCVSDGAKQVSLLLMKEVILVVIFFSYMVVAVVDLMATNISTIRCRLAQSKITRFVRQNTFIFTRY